MSIWGKLAGIGLGVAGAVTGNPALLATGASIFTGDLASSAAKDAAKTQAAAVDRGLEVNRAMYDQSRADLAPYLSLGAGTMGNLGRMVGVTPAAPGALGAPGVAPAPGAGVAGGTVGQLAGTGNPWQTAAALKAAPRERQAVTASGYGAGGGTVGQMGGPMALLQAPTGEVRSVPGALAAAYEAKGARRIG